MNGERRTGGARRRVMAAVAGAALLATVLPLSPVPAAAVESASAQAVTQIEGSVLIPGRNGGAASITLDVTARAGGGHKGAIAYADLRSGAVGGGTIVRDSIARVGRNGARGRAEVVEVAAGRLRRGIMTFEVDDLSALGLGADHAALRPSAPLRYANEGDAIAGDLQVLPVAGGAPSGTVAIDAGAAWSVDRDVVLSLAATDDTAVTAVRIADGPDPSGAAWQPYAPSVPWTLPEGDGAKVVSVQFGDAEGNVSVVATDTIVLDTTAPSITAVTGDVEVDPGADLTVSVTATDLNGIDEVTLVRPGGVPERTAMTPVGGDGFAATVADVTAPFDYYVAVTDVPGNEASSPPGARTVLHHVSVADDPGDRTPPAGSVEIDDGAELTSSTAVSLGIDASDDVGVTEMRVADGADPSAAAWQPYATSLAWTLPSGDGTKTVSVQFRDAAGNLSPVASDAIALDATAPTGQVSIESGAPYTATAAVVLGLSGTDDGGVTQMRIADGADPSAAPWEPYVTARNWTLPDGDGEKTVTVQFRDAAGNVSAGSSDSIVLDTTKPEATVSIDAGAAATASSAVDLSLTGTDANSPLMVRVANGTDPSAGSWQALVDHLAWDLPTGDGGKAVAVQVKDPAGNVSELATDDILLDGTGPELTDPTGDTSADPGDDVEIAVAATDGRGVTSVDVLTRPVGSSDPFARIGLVHGAGDRWSVTLDDVAADLDYHLEAIDGLGNASRAPGDAPTHLYRLDVSGTNPFQAAPLDRTKPANVFDATAFLYSGTDPTQVGMTATIEARRAALLRGVVRDRDGSPHPGARVVVVGHPEYGETTTRADGAYDLVVNGGGQMAVEVSHQGFVTVQRDAPATWGAWVVLDDIVMTPLDTAHTDLTFGDPAAQVHRASPVSDADGDRRATVVVEPSTTAEMVMADGSTQPLDGGTLRVTELTVGPDGEQAMPGELPEQSAYTYAAEFSIDQAEAAGAETVRFSEPVVTYVEDFLGFPAGTTVPAGWYDRERATWVAGPSGRVIEILTDTGAGTTVDTDGDGLADTGTGGLTLDAAELARLATLYDAGAVLWRVGLDHFSSWDFNWGWGPPADAVFPDNPRGFDIDGSECPPSPGSAVYCADQTLGESIPVAGTPWALNYRSDRHQVPDRFTLQVPASGPVVPPSLERITVTVTVAGRRLVEERPPAPDTTVDITWDGLDSFGRRVNGEQLAQVDIGFVYGAFYEKTAAFGYNGGGADTITGDRTRREVTLHQSYDRLLGAWDDTGFGLGGWSLTPLHAYDPMGRAVAQGDGTTRRVAPGTSDVIVPFAGAPGATGTADGLPATSTTVGAGAEVDTAVAPDGTVYYLDSCRVRAVDPAGIVTTVIGNPADATDCGYAGDGANGPSARLNSPTDLAVLADGSLVVLDAGNYRIRRLGPDGAMSTVVGTGVDTWVVEPEPTDAGSPRGVSLLESVTAMPDGGFAFAEARSADATHLTSAIRRVHPDGAVSTLAGGCSPSDPCRNMYQTAAEDGPWDPSVFRDVNGEIQARPDGSVLVANRYARSFGGTFDNIGWDVKVITPGGGLVRLADPRLSPSASIRDLNWAPSGLAVTPAGGVFVSNRMGVLQVVGDTLVRRAGIDANQSLDAVALPLASTGVEAALARRTYHGYGLSALPTGELIFLNAVFKPYSGQDSYFTYERITSGQPGFSGLSLTVPSEDGTTVSEFSPAGALARTVDAYTGVTMSSVEYGADGYATGLVDRDGRRTTIERDADGVATAIVAPGGQRTTLAVGGDGLLDSVTDPTGRTTTLTHTPIGLLTELVDPAGQVHLFEYDGQGRLAADTTPGRGRATLTRAERPNGATVTYTSPGGLVTSYAYDTVSAATVRRVTTPGGAETVTTTFGTTSTVQYPDGTVETRTMGADPRFGTAVPLVTKTVTTYPDHPSYPNQSSTETMGRAVERNAAGAVTKVTDSYAVSGVSGSSSLEWVASTRTLTLRTPDGRTLATELDALGRPWRVTRGTLTADVAQYTYDGRGRTTSVTQGSSVLTADWSAADLPVRMVDAAGRETHLQWDAAARLVGFDGPGTAEWAFGYDAAGRRDRVTSPSGGVHQLGFDPSGQLVSYLAPGAPGPLGYTYDADGRRSSATLPDGRTQAYGRDGAGQITSITSADAAMEITQELTAGRTQPSLIRRTPAGGVAQDLAIEAAGPRVTATEMTGPAAARFSYTHDAAGLLAGITLTSGADTVTMSRASSPVGLVTNGPVSFTRSGPLGSANATSAAGMSGVFTYATTGRLAGRRFHVGGVTQFSETLTYDAGRRVTRVVEQFGSDPAVTWDHERDAQGRLWRVVRDGALVAEYGYDADGNRTSMPAGAATYDSGNRITSLGGSPATVDANGFLVAEPGATYTYDSRGQLVSATVGGQSVSYTYDGLGRRVTRTDAGGTTQYLYGDPDDSLAVTATRDPAGVLTAYYYYYYDDGGRLVALSRAGVSYAVATDRLGSPRLVRSSAGAVVRTGTWDPTGRPLAGAGAFDLVIGWGGGITDPVTGLVRFGLRDYDPDTGRWTTPDPALFGGGSTNLYVHAGNDPVSLVDRSGAFSIEGSFYQGFGGGGKLAVTSEGFSFCTEVGVGFGVSTGVSLDGGLDPTGHTGFAELQAGVGQFALALRGQQDLVHGGCPSQLSFKACALACGTFEVFPQEGDGMVRPADGLPSFEPQLESNLKPSSPKALSIQAKMGISSCASFSW